ncbi:MAG: glycosyltransferase family 2 protein [Candidatus Roizmanbacteria bacterium]|nr:glycosyltransferase family 2 protein [Candidatus Roizmanbacteria bacterium]
MKLSLCIAVYNEEKNLHYPLDSAIDIADEVIIVDGGSTDRTIEVAKSYGKKIRIINSDNPVMFHKNKQKAIEAAQGEWILQLDADEVLSENLKKEIKSIVWRQTSAVEERSGKNAEVNQLVAYNLPRKNWFLTGFLMKGGQYPDYTIRLYKNGFAKFPCKDVHENVEIIQKSKVKSEDNNETMKQLNNGTIGFLKNPILHYADPDFSRYLARWDRYTTAEVERMPKDMKLNFFSYFVWKPKMTFLMMYFRHKGFMDGFPGFVFALFSSIRFWVIYIKWRTKKLT